MIRDRLRKLVRGVARSVIGGSPRIPNAGPTQREAPTQRSEWQPPVEEEPPPELELSAADVLQRIADGESVVLIDVRETHELWSGHARDAILAPMSQFQDIAETLPDGPLLAIYCAAGARSYGIADFLRQNGRDNAWSIPEGFSGLIDAGGAWLQPATDTDWKLLQNVRLTKAAKNARGIEGKSPTGSIQAIEQTPDGHQLTLRTRDGERLTELSPDELERIGRG
jgi:rhodanese-related sulfurtransferase